MTSNLKKYKLKDVCVKITDGSHYSPKPQKNGYPMLSVKDMLEYCFNYSNCKFISADDYENMEKNGCVPQKNDILVAKDGSYLKQIFICKETKKEAILSSIAIFRPNTDIIVPRYLCYLLKSPKIYNYISLNCVSGSALPRIVLKDFKTVDIEIPPLETQQKIAKVLSAIDDKIELNNSINNNLEQQIQAIFVNMFVAHIDNIENEGTKLLSELVRNIDNRGKTPPLSMNKTNYPIIDVRALSGNTRIINYNNCTKYVEEETYNNWFRNGHPQKYDILLSTVGSLAEMKLFLGNIGCIAQNVVGYRCNISPLYLYQYLNYIKKDLLAYDIGSVQPSIKVTHIAKHPIFIPKESELQQFHKISEAITNEIYSNSLENERLVQLRDTLLPKLMSGEIDVDKVEV